MTAPQLQNLLGYRLSVAHVVARRALDREIADTGLCPIDTSALLFAKDRPGIDQTALGRALGHNRAWGMKVASRLAASGLVERRVGRDRRSICVFVTARGEAVLAGMMDRHQNADAAIAAGLDDAERAVLISLLTRLAAAEI